MNTWGTGSFENESATEFIKEVLEDGPVALEEAFEVTLDPDTTELEAEEGARALAAAEIVLSQLSGEREPVTDPELRAWLDDLGDGDLSELRELALESLDRVLAQGSELPDLWQDSPDSAEWRASVKQLRAGLASLQPS
jgi:Domain of unknown function (DUF4259)